MSRYLFAVAFAVLSVAIARAADAPVSKSSCDSTTKSCPQNTNGTDAAKPAASAPTTPAVCEGESCANTNPAPEATKMAINKKGLPGTNMTEKEKAAERKKNHQ